MKSQDLIDDLDRTLASLEKLKDKNDELLKSLKEMQEQYTDFIYDPFPMPRKSWLKNLLKIKRRRK